MGTDYFQGILIQHTGVGIVQYLTSAALDGFSLEGID
jgi:hypothetical protein